MHKTDNMVLKIYFWIMFKHGSNLWLISILDTNGIFFSTVGPIRTKEIVKQEDFVLFLTDALQ